MATRSEIKPDEHGLALRIAMGAMRAANSASTARAGSVYIPNGDGTGTIIGELAGTDGTGGANGVAPWVGDTTPPGRPTGISCSSAWGTLYVSWDGTLEGGVPADFAYVSVLVDGQEVERLTGAGTAVREDLENGSTVQVSAVAYDAARDSLGNPAPNVSQPWGPQAVAISDERAEIDAAVADANEKADALQGQMEDVTASVNGVEQEVGELTSKVEGAVEDAGAALTAATEAKQTATEVSSTAERAYEDAQSALSQASSAVQTATQLQQTVTEDYLSKDDAAGTYAAKSDVTQTADEIRQDVSETYVSKEDADSTFTTKTEFEQTTEGISASVSQAVSTADNAYAKASQVEQTAEGLQVTLTETKATADNALSTANAAKKQVWHTATGTSGTAGYIGIATIKITSDYANVPLYFEFTSRNKKATPVWIRFTSANSADPTLNSLTADGDANVYIRKTAASTWQVIVQKSENYDQVSVTDFNNGGNYMDNRVTVTWTNTMLTSLPSGYIKATVLAGKRSSSDIDNAAKTATNYLKFDSSGLCVGNMTRTLGYNTLIKSTGVDIRNGSTVLSSFGASEIALGANSPSSSISLVGDSGYIKGSQYGTYGNLSLSSTGGVALVSGPRNSVSPSDNFLAVKQSGISLHALGGTGKTITFSSTYASGTLADFPVSRGHTGEWTWMTFASGIRIAWLVHGGWGFRANAQTYTDFTLPWTAHNANYAVFYGLTNFASGSQPPGFTGAHFITTNATTTRFRANCWNDSNSAFTCGVAIMVLDRPWG